MRDKECVKEPVAMDRTTCLFFSLCTHLSLHLHASTSKLFRLLPALLPSPSLPLSTPSEMGPGARHGGKELPDVAARRSAARRCTPSSSPVAGRGVQMGFKGMPRRRRCLFDGRPSGGRRSKEGARGGCWGWGCVCGGVFDWLWSLWEAS